MQKTINPKTQHPYTISMIERLLHEIHFAVDPHNSSKKQALEAIRELQTKFPIKRCPMRLRLIIPERHSSSLMEKLNAWNAGIDFKDESSSSLMEKLIAWNAGIDSKDESGNQLSVVCQMEPGFFRDCDALVRSLQGRLEILAVSAHVEGDTYVDHFDDHEELPLSVVKESTEGVHQLIERIQKQTISTENRNVEETVKQNKCSTCDAFVGDAMQY